MSPRPPARDQPPPEETAALHARLVEVVAQRRRLNAATMLRGPGARLAFVAIEGDGHAWLAMTEHGTLIAERTVDTRWLIEQLGDSPRFEDLAVLVEHRSEP